MSIAAYVMSLHGGTISAASQGEGRGATFTVLLPVRGGPPANVRAAPPPHNHREPKSRARLDVVAV